MKIAFLGNSLVEGSYGGNFVAEVAALLPNHTVINAGRNGSTILNLLRRLDDVLEQEPDGVFVLCGGNDAISYYQPDTRRYYEQVQGVPGGVITPELYMQSYRDLLTRIQLAHALAWVALAPVEYSPETVAAMQHYNGLARAVAQRLNVPILDLMAAFAPQHFQPRESLSLKTINLIGQRIASGWADYEAERQRGGYTYTFDGLHLTPQSAKQVARLVLEFLAL
jgi:lysophospholipase L1-like esterase